jgi:hypothetical protein
VISTVGLLIVRAKIARPTASGYIRDTVVPHQRIIV